MIYKSRILRFFIFLLVPAFLVWAIVELSLTIYTQPKPVAAHIGDAFGPACGKPTIDGEVTSGEWSTASKQTFLMQRVDPPTQMTATFFVMNSANNLYLGFTIDDNEFTTVGQFLPQGDELNIYFDNDHSGTLFALDDDVIVSSAGLPQFSDRFIVGNPAPTTHEADVDNGGITDGASVASRVDNKNNFELEHPLCSGDSLDFCLHANDVVGFSLRYLDVEANGDFGGVYIFLDTSDTSEADIVIGDCNIPDIDTYIPIIMK